jgi:BirA family transcriptional regulator, biotin operon repressor / biotin---[acetyl-CoA-carboxylase] ligase|tara:strand:- start:4736 stop:5464 length:729 start_codon:yes stop_codon:yes gene_type:complete
LIEIKIDATESTNDYLKQMMRRLPVTDGTMVSTDHQTKGKGQRGSSWYFEVDNSLAISILKQFDGVGHIYPFQVQMRVSIAIIQVLDRWGVPDLQIKWPNDIMSDGLKIAGILIENLYQGHLKSSVIGLGLNVNNESMTDLPKASSLFLATQKISDISALKKAIYQEIMKELAVIDTAEFANDKERYETRLYRKGESAQFMTDTGRQFEGTIRGVSQEGLLQIEDQTQQVQSFDLKTIVFLD